MKTFPHIVLACAFTIMILATCPLPAEAQESMIEQENIASQQLKKLDHAFSPSSTNSEQSLKKDLEDSRIEAAKAMMDERQAAALDQKATNNVTTVK